MTRKEIFSLKFVELQNFQHTHKNGSVELKIKFSFNIITPYIFWLDLIKPVL